MSRRKQARPSRANLEEELVQGLLRNNPVETPEDETQEENDTASEGGESNSVGCVVGVEATGSVVDYAVVDLTAARSNHDGVEEDERENDDMPMDEDETDELVDEIEEQDEDEEGSRKQMRHRQDAENNNSFIGEGGPTSVGAAGAATATAGTQGIVGSGSSSSGSAAGPGGAFPSAGTSHVTLEALQNTKVAVAQFAATALAGGADSEAALQDLALLQSTLYTLQHQQVFQLQLISQLQQQLSITHAVGAPVAVTPTQQIISSGSVACGDSTIDTIHQSIAPTASPETNPSKETSSSSPLIHAKTIASLTSPPSSRPPSHHRASSSPLLTPLAQQDRASDSCGASPIALPLPATSTMSLASSVAATTSNTIDTGISNGSSMTQVVATPMSHQMHMCSISSSLASSIITNNDPLPLHEPNTLEMLQKRAQEVLDNASQGLLANNLADELAFRSGKGSRLSPYDSKSGGGGRGEPLYKHRCRYCGKVFGSDSALQIHIRSHTVRGNTTCNICYKTFACNSALEIHYRSHTKERPFKCSICDRGFSTKGNMKQHMLTHKIRDMPPHLFNDSKQPGQQQQHQQHHQQQELENSTSPMCMDESSLPPPPPPPPPPLPPMPPSSMESPIPVKRSPSEGDLPAPKRPSMSSKHLCQVCNKNFSSSSALQIHMRTHTGDKPFRCTVCQKAFTTKGNLKVHMGTHMWTNGASRRGRRMSLDLPPLPITPKDSEFLQRRPDLFYPYLPAPFLNGVQQKLNEISVIQSNNGLPAHPVSAGKYAGLFGSLYGGGGGVGVGIGGFPMEKQPMAPSNGPMSDGKSSLPSGSMLFQTPSPSHSPGTPSSNTGNQNSASVPAWSGETIQHHFDRDVTISRPENNSTPPRIQPPRGEGLAA